MNDIFYCYEIAAYEILTSCAEVGTCLMKGGTILKCWARFSYLLGTEKKVADLQPQ